MDIAVGGRVDKDELVSLYEDVGWTSYTDAPDDLARAIANSSFVVTARDHGILVGLARGLSDPDIADGEVGWGLRCDENAPLPA